jgi:hypothetical protein
MKALNRFVLAALLAALPLAAAAQEEATDSTSGSIEIGARYVDVDGSPDKAAEFLSTDKGPVGKLELETFGGWGSLDFDFEYLATNEMKGNLDFDVNRMVRSHNSYTMFEHRLGHDPMENLEATSTNGKVVIHTDFSPEAEYGIDYSVFHDRTELQFPGLKALTLAVEYRNQSRSGHMQAYTTSHCDTCHIKSQAHNVDETTTDAKLEAVVGWKNAEIRGSMTSRELRQGTNSVNVTFDDALHPELRLPVFDNRLQFDSEVGVVPADLWPDIDKDIGRLDFRWGTANGLAVTANGVWSETENRYTGYKADYTGYVATVAKRFTNNLRLRWRGRVYSIDNDEVFVDTIERVTNAGPHAGLTYEDIYGLNFDHIRYSALDRDAVESKLDVSFRLGRKGGTLRGLWDYETVDREFYEVLPGETETTTNILGVSYRVRPVKGLRFDAAYRHAEISNAFMLINGACSTLESDAYPNPWSPETPQYHDFHDERIAETTSSPSSWDKLELGAAWVAGTSTLSGRYVWWDGSNSDGDLTDWSKNRQSATVTWWTPGGESWDWYLGYAYQDTSLDAPACIPVFDG